MVKKKDREVIDENKIMMSLEELMLQKALAMKDLKVAENAQLAKTSKAVAKFSTPPVQSPRGEEDTNEGQENESKSKKPNNQVIKLKNFVTTTNTKLDKSA